MNKLSEVSMYGVTAANIINIINSQPDNYS